MAGSDSTDSKDRISVGVQISGTSNQNAGSRIPYLKSVKPDVLKIGITGSEPVVPQALVLMGRQSLLVKDNVTLPWKLVVLEYSEKELPKSWRSPK